MKMLRRMICLLLAVAAAASMCVASFAITDWRDKRYIALPGDVSYELNVEGGKLTLLSNLKTPKEYATKDSALALRVDDYGLVLSFTTSGGSYKEVVLGKDVKLFSVTGTLNSLALTDTVDYHYTVEVDAMVNELTVTGDCTVKLSENTGVNKLGIHNSEAEVSYAPGAFIADKNVAPVTDVQLDVDIREFNYFTAHASYDKLTNTVTLPATMPGCTVQEAMRDVILRVEEFANVDLVSGRWYWPNLNGGSTESGTYIYRFIPTDNKHESTYITVNFISHEDNENAF